MPQRIVHKLRAVKGETWIKYIAIVVSITAVVSAVGAYRENSELKSSLRDSCVKTRAPLHTYFEFQLAQNEQTDISQFFPNVPEEKLTKLLAASLANLQTIVRVYDPARCESDYR